MKDSTKQRLLWLLLCIALPLASCSKDDGTAAAAESFNVEIECPSLIEVSEGGEYTFRVTGGDGLFGSDNDCTRAQIVTFIWRSAEK